MKALRFYDVQDLRYEDAPDPVIEKPDDVIVKVKAVGICGSDIARYRNLGPYVPGNVWGHEFCGEVVEVGKGVKNLKPGDRVVGCPNMVCLECGYDKQGDASGHLVEVAVDVVAAEQSSIQMRILTHNWSVCTRSLRRIHQTPRNQLCKNGRQHELRTGCFSRTSDCCDSWSVSDKYQNGMRSSCCRMWKYRSDGNRMGESFRSKESICN